MKTPRRRWWIAPVVLALAAGAGVAADWLWALPTDSKAEFVGRQSCAQCHATQMKAFEGSDHDKAMEPANAETVLGDFNDTRFEHHGLSARMFKKGDDFFVETAGKDGQTAAFKVAYTFGYRPLQQYLLEFERGRMQVAPVTWDVNKKEWFILNPDDVPPPGDVLHWTRSSGNWNHMCADCHSTGYAKNYDAKTDTFHSTWHEMDVSCEACHGPASLHVKLAESKSLFWDRNLGFGLAQLKASPQNEIDTCAPCHSHRRTIAPGYAAGQSFHDHYGLNLLDDNLYHPDGQIDEEAYEVGSFEQSKMYRNKVRCTDCHDPHTTRVKFPDNRLCTECHQNGVAPHPAGKFDGQSHHHHPGDGPGTRCVDCHMPGKLYMEVDFRRDHSLRVPRPDLTLSLGTPNACNTSGCHDGKARPATEDAAWAAQKVVEWYGPKRKQDPHYGEILAAGRLGKPQAEKPLIDLAKLRSEALYGPNVRATAVALLGTRYDTITSLRAVETALEDPEPIVREAATRAASNLGGTRRSEALGFAKRLVGLLEDPARMVRAAAAPYLQIVSPDLNLTPEEQDRVAKVFAEYRQGLSADADQWGVHMTLGNVYETQGKLEEARDEYQRALAVEPSMIHIRTGLARVQTQLGQAAEAKRLWGEEAKLLAENISRLPADRSAAIAELYYFLGQAEFSRGEAEAAEQALLKATETEPERADHWISLAEIRIAQGKVQEGAAALQKALALRPNDSRALDLLNRLRQ